MKETQLRSVTVKELKCRTCDHTWFPRVDSASGKVRKPKNCPNPGCKSPYYNKPYIREVKKRKV